MRNRWFIFIIALIVILILSIVVTFTLAPESTAINFGNSADDSLACLSDDEDACLVMPSVTGLNINSAEVVFPVAFQAEYHLVVMPFDREQQVLAVTWLPLFQELAAENDNLQYWSIAALPELNAAIRLLVIGGIRVGISDADVRTQVTVLFLDEQDSFLDALAIESIDAIQSFIIDSDGLLYYREIGEYSAEKGDSFRAALEQLLGEA